MDNQRKAAADFPKDKLEAIFALQKRFDDFVAESRGLDKSNPEKWIQRTVLAMISELSELLDEVNFKWWKNPKPVDHDALKGELVDILHFYISMCLTAGITADELFSAYRQKNEENFARQAGKSEKKGYELNGK